MKPKDLDQVSKSPVPAREESILRKKVWREARRMRCERVISKPHFYFANECEACGKPSQHHGSFPWCPDCAIWFAPYLVKVHFKRAQYDEDVKRARKGAELPPESEVVRDIRLLAEADGETDGKIGILVGIPSRRVREIRKQHGIVGRAGFR